jgi:hypothetical protein
MAEAGEKKSKKKSNKIDCTESSNGSEYMIKPEAITPKLDTSK